MRALHHHSWAQADAPRSSLSRKRCLSDIQSSSEGSAKPSADLPNVDGETSAQGGAATAAASTSATLTDASRASPPKVSRIFFSRTLKLTVRGRRSPATSTRAPLSVSPVARARPAMPLLQLLPRPPSASPKLCQSCFCNSALIRRSHCACQCGCSLPAPTHMASSLSE